MTLITASTTVTTIAPGMTMSVAAVLYSVRTAFSPRAAVQTIGPSSAATIAAGRRRATTPDRTSAPPNQTAQDQNRRCNRISHSRPFPLLPKGPIPEPRK